MLVTREPAYQCFSYMESFSKIGTSAERKNLLFFSYILPQELR